MFSQPCGMNHCQNNIKEPEAMNAINNCNGCPQPQPVVAPKKVCVSNQVTPVAQPVICPIECRRVNHCMYYPVYYPQYEQTFMNVPFNQF